MVLKIAASQQFGMLGRLITQKLRGRISLTVVLEVYQISICSANIYIYRYYFKEELSQEIKWHNLFLLYFFVRGKTL